MVENPNEGVTDTVLSPGAADLAIVAGHPAIVSAKPIVTGTGSIEQTPGTEFVHISIRFLDAVSSRTIEGLPLQGRAVLEGPTIAQWRNDPILS